MSAPQSTGSSTAPAAAPATIEAAAPTTAAPQTEPIRNTPYEAPTRKQKNFAPRQNITTSSGRSNPGLSMLLSGVSDFNFNGIKYNDITYIVPCLIQFYYVLSLMDTQMVHTKRFTDANSDWHPFVSQIYFGILVYYQTLKNQRIGGSITHEQNLFLEFLENTFKAEHLKIPGPLVIFFQGLAACAGPTENYGNVIFGIPNNLNVRQASDFQPDNRLDFHLPNIIFMLDQFMRTLQDIAPVGAVPGPVAQASTDRVYMSIYGVAAANAAANRDSMMTPSARHEVQVTTGLLANLASSSNIWRTTLPFDPATNNSTYVNGANQNALGFDQILGFRGFGATAHINFGWFQQVIRIMQPYGDFFKDTVSLGAITTTGIGISYIRTQLSNTAVNAEVLTHEITVRDVRYQAAGTSRYAIPFYTGITTQHRHSEEYLDAVTEQAGIMTQLWVSWSLLNQNANTVYSGPLNGNVAAGPFPQRVDLRRTGFLVVPNVIPPIVSGYYHTPAALKFE
jgi:hypothetical protein